MFKSPAGADDVHVDHFAHDPAVHCLGCSFEWRSRAMADGLRLLGSCPKCGAELAFAPDRPASDAGDRPIVDVRAPHLVLGVPRR